MIDYLFKFFGYRIEKITLAPRRPSVCGGVQFSDQMVCQECNLSWDVNDAYPPDCKPKVLENRHSRMIIVAGRPTIPPKAPPVKSVPNVFTVNPEPGTQRPPYRSPPPPLMSVKDKLQKYEEMMQWGLKVKDAYGVYDAKDIVRRFGKSDKIAGVPFEHMDRTIAAFKRKMETGDSGPAPND